MKKLRIFLTDLLILILIIYTLANCNLTVYGLSLAKGQLKIILNAEPINKLILSNKISATQLRKIKLINTLKKYSVDSLNYSPSNNYTSYYNQNGKPLLWVVTACEEFNLKDYIWEFPYLGKTSYKGYFNFEKANTACEELRLNGFDADVCKVNAWSTLGWTNDPIFSEMLTKSEADLAELIFHELFHGTIYAKNSVNLNENLADFISHKATLLYFKNDTIILNQYKQNCEKDKKINQYIFECISKIDKLYTEFKKNRIPKSKMRLEKLNLLKEFGIQLKKRFKFSKKQQQFFQTKFIESKNAFFMQYKRYKELNDSLEIILQKKYKSNLPKMIQILKIEIKSV